MTMADDDGRRLDAARAEASGIATVRETADGGIEQGQSAAAKAAAWGALIFGGATAGLWTTASMATADGDNRQLAAAQAAAPETAAGGSVGSQWQRG